MKLGKKPYLVVAPRHQEAAERLAKDLCAGRLGKLAAVRRCPLFQVALEGVAGIRIAEAMAARLGRKAA